MSRALPAHPSVEEHDAYHCQLRDFFWDLLEPYKIIWDEDRWKETRRCPGCGQAIHRGCQLTLTYPNGGQRLTERLIADPPSGALIRERRLKADLSIEALAMISGVSPSAIRHLETGRPASPRTIRRIAMVPQLGFLNERPAGAPKGRSR